MKKDVHTGHCCILHGCKYGKDDKCTVLTKKAKQEYLCESCGDDGDLIVDYLWEEKINLKEYKKLRIQDIEEVCEYIQVALDADIHETLEFMRKSALKEIRKI
jgi:hypothetical protein